MSSYKARRFKSHDIIKIAGIQLKSYTIAAEGREDLTIHNALAYAKRALPESPIPWMHHYGLGYLMYHAGEESDWFLLRVWIKGQILTGLVSSDSGDGFKPVCVPLIECVWESRISSHERDAWVKHMMSARSDPEAYLADLLPDGMH